MHLCQCLKRARTELERTLLLTGLAVRTREPRNCSSVRPCSFRMPTSSFALGRFAGLWSRQASISWAIDAGHSSGTLRNVRCSEAQACESSRSQAGLQAMPTT